MVDKKSGLRLVPALLLLYDVTNKASYDNIRAWLSEIREHANEDVVIMLLGESRTYLWSPCRYNRPAHLGPAFNGHFDPPAKSPNAANKGRNNLAEIRELGESYLDDPVLITPRLSRAIHISSPLQTRDLMAFRANSQSRERQSASADNGCINLESN